MNKKYFRGLICILAIFSSYIFTSMSFCQEEAPQPPRELIEQMLANENIPEEAKRELEQMLKEGVPTPPIVPPEVVPEEEQPPPLVEEEIEEVEELQRFELREPVEEKPRIISSPISNKISLDLKGMDIIDVLKMLSARSNLNIVAGRNVRGKVTLFLKDVDVWDAFEIILAANDLAYIKEGDIINVMTERDYEQLYGERYYDKKDLRIFRLEYAKASEVSKALNQAKSKVGKVIVDEGSNTIVIVDSPKAINEMEKMIAGMDMPIETKIFSLDYAKAEDVKTKISEILTKNVGTIQVDERTNKLVITDLSKRMPEISKIIEEVDERHKEVLIEAKIVQIELNDEYKYGVNWKAVFHKNPDEGIRSYFDNISGNVFAGGAIGGSLTIAQVAHDYLDMAIEALQTVGKTNVISSPRITVLNNEEAKVLVGTNQPYITTTTTVPEGGQSITAESVTFIDVGISLTVTPTINKDGFVTMKIKPEVSSLGTPLETAEGNEIPVVSTSETETTIMVKDGTTIIIAGLIEDRDIESENKIPLLGDIPIIGHLFKSRTEGSSSQPEKKELVVFLTPYIVGGTEIFPETENVTYTQNFTQRDILEKQISLAVEDLNKRRSLVREIPPKPVEEKDKTTRISEDIKWLKKPEKVKEEKEAEVGKEEAKASKEKEEVKEAKKIEEKATVPPQYIIPLVSSGYYKYYEDLRNRIYWFAKDYYPRHLRGKGMDIELLFTVASDGRLIDEPKVLNKVDKELAEAAKNAISMASPFPAFPKDIDKEEESFRITISYE